MRLWLIRVQAWLTERPLVRFMFAVAALLPAAFLAWYFLGAQVAGPATQVASLALGAWIPDLVAETRLDDTYFVVVSTLAEGGKPADPEIQDTLGFAINTRSLSYSMPFYCALYFATPQRGGAAGFAWSLIALWLLMAVGIVATALRDLLLTMGPALPQRGDMPSGDAIALAYQFSVLMVPPLAPVALWAYGAADTPTFRELFAVADKPDQAKDSAT